MRRKVIVGGTLISVAALFNLFISRTYGQLRSFGEAEGFGAVATGARASATPTIYHVTNLNDSGAGSFRDAVSASNRFVVFDVGGMINLSSAVLIQSNVTIAGQTAPGGGILFTGYELSGSSQSNIIMRFVRVSPGDSSPSTNDAIALHNSNNIMLDHLSLEFANWNNIDAVTDNGIATQVTIQNSIVADPINQQFVAHTESLNGAFTWSNNLLVNAHNRMPLAKVDTIFKDNVVYNYGAGYTVGNTSGVFSHDIINNYFIAGPGTSAGNTFYQMNTNQSIYSSGNLRDSNLNSTLDGTSISPSGVITLNAPWSPLTLNLPTISATDAYGFVTTHAGDSIVRDDLDNLVVSQVQTLGNGTTGTVTGTAGPDGGMYHHAYNTGLSNNGLGTIASASRPAGFDSDNDGISDTWEIAHGMNPNNASDALLKNALGYFMIEQYINELGAVNDSRTWSAASGNWSTAGNWTGSIAPGPFDYAKIRGNGATAGQVTISSGNATAMTVSLGGNGPLPGEQLMVSGGKLDVYDTITVGDQNNATLAIAGGTVETYNVILGNTVYNPSATNFTGTLNFSSGTLALSQLVRGAGVPGNWNSGGVMNWSGGMMLAVANLNINVPIALSGTGTINTAGYSATINGNLSGSGILTKTGAGTLTFVGNNSGFSGPISLNADTLSLAANASNSPTGTITLAGGTTLNIASAGSGTATPMAVAGGASATLGTTATVAYNGAISGAANATLKIVGASTGGNNFSLGGNLGGFSGTLDFSNAGNIRLTNSAVDGSAAAKWVLGSGNATLRTQFGGTVNAGSLSGGPTTTLQGTTNNANPTTYVIGANNGSTTFAGLITDSYFSTTSNGTIIYPGDVNITKSGTGTVALTGTGSFYTGSTTISGGTLSIPALTNGGVPGPLGAASADAGSLVLDGGTLAYTGSNTTTTDRLFSVTANGGTLNAGAAGQWRFLNIGTIGTPGSGNRTLTLTGTTLSSDLFASLGDPAGGGMTTLDKEGAGRWILNNPATPRSYSGNTIINAGTLMQAADNQLPYGPGKGNLAVNAGTFEMNGFNLNINGLSGGGNVNQQGGFTRTLTLGNGDAGATFSGMISNVGSGAVLNLVKTGLGTQTFTGNNTFTGTTTINAGSLVLGNNSASGSLGAGAVITNATLAFNRSDNITFVNPLSGNGGVSLLAAHTVTLSGAVSFSGSASLVSGSRLILSNVQADSTGGISGPGSLELAANTPLVSNGVTASAWLIDANANATVRSNGGPAGASKVSMLTLAGSLDHWQSTLNLTNNALILQSTDSTSNATAFSTLQNQIASGYDGGDWLGFGITSSALTPNTTLALFDNADLQLSSYRGQSLDNNSLIVVQAPLADGNMDGKVDSLDLTLLADHWQEFPARWSQGDFNGDGKVDSLDLTVLANNWQLGGAALADGGSLQDALAHVIARPAGPTQVPEPGTALLLGAFLPALLKRGRRNCGTRRNGAVDNRY